MRAGSRLVGGRAVHKGGVSGFRTGEGPSAGSAVKHRVTIHNHYANQVVEVDVPEDRCARAAAGAAAARAPRRRLAPRIMFLTCAGRAGFFFAHALPPAPPPRRPRLETGNTRRYVMWEAEDKGLELPYACRMGCCTACAVRIKSGEMHQPEALGISLELREQGYGLMCVGYPLSDLVLETVGEDEVYDLQFGASFATQALDPSNPAAVERDDFALGIANMDE